VVYEIQAERLAAFGASPSEVGELLRYNENPFDLSSLGPGTVFPLPDEPFVAVWEAWVEEARARGAFAVLREHLPQLRFPVQAGISRTEDYIAATRRGVPPDRLAGASGLTLTRPDLLELVLHPSPAGRIPVLVIRGREEFATLLRALARKGEPDPVPDSQGALMVSGYNNWVRIRELQRRWEARDLSERETATWSEEFARITPRRELYQDRFILLSNGPYSAVPASDLGLDEDEWREISLAIRRDHECAHYFTRRLFGAMRNNALDELIADYAGLVGALGRYRADWFLRFLGLEEPSCYREGARLEIYRGDPPLSEGAFRVLQALVREAAANVGRFDAGLPPGPRSLQDRALALTALASHRLEDLAALGGDAVLRGTFEELRGSLNPSG
jgi:hypothetical protein